VCNFAAVLAVLNTDIENAQSIKQFFVGLFPAAHDYKIITRLCNRVPSLQGVAITIATAAIGISAAHLVIREFMARYMKT
jgi:hypothetical protein